MINLTSQRKRSCNAGLVTGADGIPAGNDAFHPREALDASLVLVGDRSAGNQAGWRPQDLGGWRNPAA